MFSIKQAIIIFFFSVSLPAFGVQFHCGSEDSGLQEEFLELVRVEPHEYGMYEIYFPKKYRAIELSLVQANMTDLEGRVSYFQLNFKEKKKMYYLHLGIESIDREVSLMARYGDKPCAFNGRVTLKNNQ